MNALHIGSLHLQLHGDQFHWTNSARVNRGWSKVVIGICPAWIAIFNCTSTSCFIITGVADFSLKRGSIVHIDLEQQEGPLQEAAVKHDTQPTLKYLHW